MAKDNQRIVLTKRLLKEGLLRLLEKKELQKISVSELCAEAGINRATFYRHYEIPRDILEDIGKDIFYKLIEDLKSPDLLENLEDYIGEMCRYLYSNADIIRIMFRSSSDPEVFHYIREMYQMILKEYEKKGAVEGLDAESIRFVTTYFSGGGYFVLREWLMEDIQKTPKEMAELIYRLTCRGEVIMEKTKELLKK